MQTKPIVALITIVAIIVLAAMTSTAQAQPQPPPEYDVTSAPYNAQCNSAAVDSTAAFQAALDAAALAGGGIVRVPHCRFWFDGHLQIGHGVVLAGRGIGPYDPNWNPGTGWPSLDPKVQGPTLLPRLGTASPPYQAFIQVNGSNSAIQDLIIHYWDQYGPGQHDSYHPDGIPVEYPPAIAVFQPTKISRCLISNSFKAIDIRVGRVFLDMLHIGAFSNDIVIDNALDLVRISQVTLSTFWNYGVAVSPQLDEFAIDNGVGVTSFRADTLSLHDINVHYRNIGIALREGSTGAVTYGRGSDIDLDAVNNGIVASATQPVAGFQFTNLSVGPENLAPGVPGHMIVLENTGTAYVPRIVVVGGSTRTTWLNNEPLKVDAGTLRVRDIVGLSPIGRLPVAGIPKPTLPASGASYVSNVPTEARVVISGGTVTDVQIGGVSMGTRSVYLVAPGDEVKVFYTGQPNWEWVVN